VAPARIRQSNGELAGQHGRRGDGPAVNDRDAGTPAVASGRMRVLVCGWIGSTNLGDELVFAGVRRLLATRQARVAAVSVDPARTWAQHGVAAIDHRRIDRIAAATRRADLVVWGGGGLVQDETSPFNLPYHLSRAWLALLAGTPVIGLGLGVGPLHSAVGRRLARTLAHAAAVTVRDQPSLEELAALGVPARLAADTAVHLASPPAPLSAAAFRPLSAPPDPASGTPASAGAPRPEEVAVVSLRPWGGGGARIPVGWGRPPGEPAWFVPRVAGALDDLAATSGLTIRFVALQTDRDHALHRRVAARMRRPSELRTPTLGSVLEEVARARLVVAMRYHAGLAALLGGRPAALIGYSPKVAALADVLGPGGQLLPFDDRALRGLRAACLELLTAAGAEAAVANARHALQVRARVNEQALDLVSTAAGGRAPRPMASRRPPRRASGTAPGR
jgi:polysaccharide pyruvyl transferase CsaB